MKLSGSHYLIYDPPSFRTSRLKACLEREGATVAVTSSILIATRNIEARGIDLVFVPYRCDAATQTLCGLLDRLQIPKIFTGTSPHDDELRLAA